MLSFLFFAVLWFVLCRQLSGEWSVNEQYSYGWFVPFFALYLFWLRWQDRPAVAALYERGNNDIANSTAVIDRRYRRVLIAALLAIPALLLLLPVRLFEIANPDWRPLAWLHAASVAVLAMLYLWYLGGGPWLRHFAFPVAFIFVAVPWVTPIEVPIIQGLMRVVASVAAETVALFGIPAQLEGNLIRVTSGLVGVNEACSGVRSLQTSLMIGLLFGELKRLSISRRAALVAVAMTIALVANFLRAFFLVWIAATKGISEINRWHDLADYIIIVLVFIATIGMANVLRRSETGPRKSVVIRLRQGYGGQDSQRSVISWSLSAAALGWLLMIEVGAAAWYRAHEGNLVSTTRWDVRWPAGAPNFHKLKIDEEAHSVLRFDEGEAAVWTLPAAASRGALGVSNPNTTTCLLYFFRWKPGRNSALLANLHRPDVCLPAIGWTQMADGGMRNYPVTGSFALAFRHFEFRHATSEILAPQAHAFYCLVEDRVPAPAVPGSKPPQMASGHSAWTRNERIRQVVEGRRHLGQQVMEIVFLSKEPLSPADAESRLGDLVGEVVVKKDIDD